MKDEPMKDEDILISPERDGARTLTVKHHDRDAADADAVALHDMSDREVVDQLQDWCQPGCTVSYTRTIDGVGSRTFTAAKPTDPSDDGAAETTAQWALDRYDSWALRIMGWSGPIEQHGREDVRDRIEGLLGPSTPAPEMLVAGPDSEAVAEAGAQRVAAWLKDDDDARWENGQAPRGES